VTTQPGKTPEELSPRPLMRILGDFANSQILDAAIEYDFFTVIHKGFQTADEIAREAGTNPRATRIVLDSLIASALIEKKDGHYSLLPVSETFLVKGKPSYMGDFRHYTQDSTGNYFDRCQQIRRRVLLASETNFFISCRPAPSKSE
jgi:3-hydroxy-5-methyl-1-naphthoate 3-O-methyltransferase